jgi:hypothetical protein
MHGMEDTQKQNTIDVLLTESRQASQTSATQLSAQQRFADWQTRWDRACEQLTANNAFEALAYAFASDNSMRTECMHYLTHQTGIVRMPNINSQAEQQVLNNIQSTLTLLLEQATAGSRENEHLTTIAGVLQNVENTYVASQQGKNQSHNPPAAKKSKWCTCIIS